MEVRQTSSEGQGAIGAQVFPGFRPSNEVKASRSNTAAYVDVEGDLRRWLRLGAAARTERYSDFGGTLDGKITARIQPARALTRPQFGQYGFPRTVAGPVVFFFHSHQLPEPWPGLVPVESLTLPVDSAPAQALGAVALKPEQSRHVPVAS